MVFIKTVFIDKEPLERMYVDEDMTTYQIAKKLGCSDTVVGERLKEYSIPRRTQSDRNNYRMRHNKEWSAKVKKGLHFKGEATNGGYKLIYSPEHPLATKCKYVLEHRLIMERMLGRYLKLGEEVHHIDFNPSNNEEDNLYLFQDKRTHIDYHWMLRGFIKELLAEAN